MPNTLRVRWTVTPKLAPQPLLACNRCGDVKPFRSSGKVRLNAHRKLIDAWLIYCCTACDSTWNRPIFERRRIREIDPALLQALQTNDGDWVRSSAFDAGQLRRHAREIKEFPDVEVRKRKLSDGLGPWSALDISLDVPLPAARRVDRLLASELNLSRARIHSFEASGRLILSRWRNRMLRRAITDRMQVSIDLRGLSDGLTIGAVACGVTVPDLSP